MEFIGQVIVVFVWGLIAWFIVALFAAVPAWLLWNWLVPSLFELPELSLLQTFGMLLLTGTFFNQRTKVEFANGSN